MNGVRQVLWLMCVLVYLAAPTSADAHCDKSVDLSARMADFEARRASPIEALLRLGAQQKVCFGIEYVDKLLLTDIRDFHLQDTTLKGAIESILASEHFLIVKEHDGVVHVSRKTSEAGTRNIFDFVIPKWETRRGSVQEMSIALHMQLVMDLNPKITQFAGDYTTGDLQDQVGPFTEQNRKVSYLLDKIVTQSKGAAWIAQVRWGLLHDLALPEDRRVWTVVEYQGPATDYLALLRAIADDL